MGYPGLPPALLSANNEESTIIAGIVLASKSPNYLCGLHSYMKHLASVVANKHRIKRPTYKTMSTESKLAISYPTNTY